MSSVYTVYCQRCDRPATQKRIDLTRAAVVFAAATAKLSPQDVRLCSNCIRTVESLSYAIARVKRRSSV